MINFEEAIDSSYYINGYFNLFKLTEESKIIQVFLNGKAKAKIAHYLDTLNLQELSLIEKFGVKNETVKYWVSNLDKLPLTVVRSLIVNWHLKYKSNEKDFLSDLVLFLDSFEHFTCRGSFKTKIPNKPSKDLFYLSGVIMGDGSLPIKHNGSRGKQYEIVVEKANKEFINKTVRSLFWEIFELKPKLSKNHKHNRVRYRCYVKSRIIYAFLKSLMDIPAGKKSSIIRFPTILENLPVEYKFALFAGLVDTDWGKQRWTRFGTHMASEPLSKDYQTFLRSFDLELHVKKYLQKNKFTSYQCYMNIGDEQKLFSLFNEHYPLRNPKRIKFLKAGVAELGKCASMSKSKNNGFEDR